MSRSMEHLLAEIRACRICEAHLPLGPRPVLQASADSRLLIISQAPGRRVHESGVPFDDPSGDRLREWMGIDKTVFYDPRRVAIVPMGFCYPGKGKSGDLPPRPECAPTWHPRLLPRLKKVRLTLLVGHYAIRRKLGTRSARSMTETCLQWRQHLAEGCFVLPHPSPRNVGWFQRNPWFDDEVLPALRREVARTLMNNPGQDLPPGGEHR